MIRLAFAFCLLAWPAHASVLNVGVDKNIYMPDFIIGVSEPYRVTIKIYAGTSMTIPQGGFGYHDIAGGFGGPDDDVFYQNDGDENWLRVGWANPTVAGNYKGIGVFDSFGRYCTACDGTDWVNVYDAASFNLWGRVIDPNGPAPVPLPATLPLLLAALGGLWLKRAST